MGAIPDALVPFVSGGRSLLIGVRDEQLRPAGMRAVGLRVDDDRDHVTVYVPDATAGRVLAILRRVPAIAISCSEIPTHRTVQLKGEVVAIRPARDDERPLLAAYREAWATDLSYAGMARLFSTRLTNWPAHALVVRVAALFEQTPGPGAGAPFEVGGGR